VAETPARPRGRFKARFEYAVKFLCTSNIPGTSQTSSSVLPGTYQTAVNIHNPSSEPAHVRMKLALGPETVTRFLRRSIEPDALLRIDCERIRSGFGVHPIHGMEGFLIVQSMSSLDVTAVYTAGPRDGAVTSLDVEQIRERVLGGD
jgi:hypothetical protein